MRDDGINKHIHTIFIRKLGQASLLKVWLSFLDFKYSKYSTVS